MLLALSLFSVSGHSPEAALWTLPLASGLWPAPSSFPGQPLRGRGTLCLLLGPGLNEIAAHDFHCALGPKPNGLVGEGFQCRTFSPGKLPLSCLSNFLSHTVRPKQGDGSTVPAPLSSAAQPTEVTVTVS